MSFFCLLLFILFVFWRPQEWLVPALYGWPILDAVIYLSVLGLILEWDSGRVKIDFRRPQFFLFVGLFVAAIMSHAANTYFQGILDTWVDAFRQCFFGILLFANLNSVSRLRWVCRIFVALAIFMAIHALLQQQRGYGFGPLGPVMSWRPGLDYRVPRSQFYGIFGDPNDMGQMFATAMPLSFVLFKRKSFFGVAVAGLICWLLFLGVEATWSRGAYLAVYAAVGVVFIVKALPCKIHLGNMVVGGCLAILALPLFQLEGSALDRVVFWGDANRVFMSKPIFGAGFNFIGEYTDGRALHNAYVTAYSELGVFGYFFWFSLLLVGVLGTVRSRRALKGQERSAEADWLYRFSCWGLAGFAGFAASSYFLSRAFVFPLFFLMAMMGIVPYLLRELEEGDPELTDGAAISNRDVAILGGVSSLLSIAYIYLTILAINATR